MSYCDVTFADTYLAGQAFSSGWTGAEKSAFLETATRQIKDYCTFEDENGIFTYDDSAAPDWMRRATCEQALYLMNLAKDPTQADKKTTLGISASDGTSFDKSFAADIIGNRCRRILKNNGGIMSNDATSGSAELSWSHRLK